MNAIWKWVGLIIAAISLTTMFVGDLMWIWYLVKCFRVKKCYKRNCRYKTHCRRYVDILTDEDRERIQKLIDRF
ncbi:MAG: hypothetical protein K2L82_18325 [Lachnospiraceae bacterium]|nr:hypothetical protein [Lachnospiraceae bacterium]